jgi:serine/threonine protein phosphatase PrpC
MRIHIHVLFSIFLACHGVVAMDTQEKSSKPIVYATVYRQGDEDRYEDRYFVKRGGARQNMAGHSIFSLFDGCGGKLVAQYAQEKLARSIWQQIAQIRAQNQQPDMKEIFADSFKQLDEEIIHNKELRYQGSTGLVIYICDGKAYIAWSGDTRAIIIRDSKVIFSTIDHKMEEESPAMLAYSDGSECESDCEYDETDIHELKLSRAFGVLQARHWITVTPDIATVDLHKNDIVLLATKGVWSALSNDAVAQVVCQARQTSSSEVINRFGVREECGEGSAHRDMGLLHVARALRAMAYVAGSKYNITAIVAAIREQERVDLKTE